MTNQEFSDSFTTLLNSYNTQAQFGEEASRADISLDEYEKSVLLTQAQDLVVKSYFDRNFNQQGEGFDDSTRRQVDFSSLIRVALLTPTVTDLLYDSRGVIFKMPRKIINGHIVEGTTDVLFILNEKLLVETTLNDGNRKTWILNNYGDGTIKYYSEPRVANTDLSKYYLIDGDDTHYYKHPGTPINHSGYGDYWTIEGDKEAVRYSEYPTYTAHDGIPVYWTINNGTRWYYDEPVSTFHHGTDNYWTIDLDSSPQPHYSTNPGTPTHVPAVPTHWTISHQGVEDPTEYYEAIEVVSGTNATTYYTIDLDNPSIEYESDPGTPTETVTPAYWVINGDTENPVSTDPGTPVEHLGTPDAWVVNGTDSFPFDPSESYVYNKVSYWITDMTGNTQFPYDPVSVYTDNIYWKDDELRNQDSPFWRDPYIIFEPRWEYEDGTIDPTRVIGFYITSNYGTLGPFKNKPNIQLYKEKITYWLIDEDETNPYFKEVTSTEVVEAESWSLEYNGRTYIYNTEPTVVKIPGTPTKWTLVIGGETVTYNEEPTVDYHAAVSTWKFDDIDTIYTSEPHVIEHTSGGTYYQVVWSNDGTGHSAGDSVNGVIYKEPAPTINSYDGEDEYWTLAGNTYSSEPHTVFHSGQQEYWTVNVTPGVMYLNQPVFHEHEAQSPYWVIDVDERVFYHQPVIIAHNGTASYWTFTGIDKEFYTVDPPQVTMVTDPNPELNYWTINDEDIHYYGNGRPEFDVIDGVESNKSIKEYIIVPISYREYDREMSKPYAQPLKKQAWRLFQNNSMGFDFDSELIPKFNITQHFANPSQPGYNVGDVQLIYKIRYIRRPRPIILENLPNDLEIDGETMESSCELNPIIHIDILNKAVELALATRSKVQPQQNEQRRQ